MNGEEKIVVAATMTLAAGSLFLSSLATQTAAMGGQTVYDPESQKRINAIGWVATGGVAVASGLWANSKPFVGIGAGIAVLGLLWVYAVKHPVLSSTKKEGSGQESEPGATVSSQVEPIPIVGMRY